MSNDIRVALSCDALKTLLESEGLRTTPDVRLSSRVYESLSHAIHCGLLPVGARLPSEGELATLFNVSRPVVRQALAGLRQEGLLQSQRGSGSYVQNSPPGLDGMGTLPSGADLSRILQGVELRLVIEPEAAYMAAMRRSTADLHRLTESVRAFERATRLGEPTHTHDYGFHQGVARATANPRLADAVRALEYDVSHAVRVWRHWGRMRPTARLQDPVDEHRMVLDCIRTQDAEGARRAMRSHIEKARVRMIELDPSTGAH
jgi:GntR family transcriptional repressor for pyruvate dehydrogenase complex